MCVLLEIIQPRLIQTAPAKRWADGQPHKVLAIDKQVGVQMSVDPVGCDPQADPPGYIDVKTTAKAKEECSIRWVSIWWLGTELP